MRHHQTLQLMTPGLDPSHSGLLSQSDRPLSLLPGPGQDSAHLRTLLKPPASSASKDSGGKAFLSPSGRMGPAAPAGPHVKGGSTWLAGLGGPPPVGSSFAKVLREMGLGCWSKARMPPGQGGPASHPSAFSVLPAQVPSRALDTWLWARERRGSIWRRPAGLGGWARRDSRNPWWPQHMCVISC